MVEFKNAIMEVMLDVPLTVSLTAVMFAIIKKGYSLIVLQYVEIILEQLVRTVIMVRSLAA